MHILGLSVGIVQLKGLCWLLLVTDAGICKGLQSSSFRSNVGPVQTVIIQLMSRLGAVRASSEKYLTSVEEAARVDTSCSKLSMMTVLVKVSDDLGNLAKGSRACCTTQQSLFKLKAHNFVPGPCQILAHLEDAVIACV